MRRGLLFSGHNFFCVHNQRILAQLRNTRYYSYMDRRSNQQVLAYIMTTIDQQHLWDALTAATKHHDASLKEAARSIAAHPVLNAALLRAKHAAFRRFPDDPASPIMDLIAKVSRLNISSIILAAAAAAAISALENLPSYKAGGMPGSPEESAEWNAVASGAVQGAVRLCLGTDRIDPAGLDPRYSAPVNGGGK